MSDSRDIYGKAPRGESDSAATNPPAPGSGNAPPHRRAIIIVVGMVVLMVAAALYFNSLEGQSSEEDEYFLPAVKPAADTNDTVAATNTPPPEITAIESLLADLGAGQQTPSSTLSPQKMAEAMAHVRSAQQYARDRDMDAAEREIGKALIVWPDMNIAIRLLGSIYTQRGQFDRAIALLERSLEREPFSAETLNNLAINYMQKNNMAKSEELLITALQVRPDYAVAQMNLAFVHLRLNRYDLAAEYFELALRQMPGNFGAMNNLAVSLLRLGDYQRAREIFTELIEKSPERVTSYFNLAITYVMEKNEADALVWIRKGAEKTPPSQLQAMLSDPDFDTIRSLSEFQQIIRDRFPDIPSRNPTP